MSQEIFHLSHAKNKQALYWMQNISEPEPCHSKRERKDAKGKGGAV
jgi:hypothetical protein